MNTTAIIKISCYLKITMNTVRARLTYSFIESSTPTTKYHSTAGDGCERGLDLLRCIGLFGRGVNSRGCESFISVQTLFYHLAYVQHISGLSS
jgi:hypothetical protein